MMNKRVRKGAGMTVVSRRTNIFNSIKYSIHSAKPDSLSCADSLSLVSSVSPDSSKRQVCMTSIGAKKTTYWGWVKLKSYVLTIHLGEGDSDLQTLHCLVGHPWLV